MSEKTVSEACRRIMADIRDVPDFPKPGIMFKDITPLLAHPETFAEVIRLMAEPFAGKGITKVLGIEARGFLLAAPVAMRLNAGIVPVRKKGKLPYKTVSASYDLEYGTDILQVHEDAVKKGEKVLIVDDVLATGGTAGAVCALAEKLGGRVEGLCMLIELEFLKGRSKLVGREVHSLVRY